MESVLGRYRNLIILMGVLFLQVLGLAVQVKRGGNDTENTRLIRIWAVGAITPLERGVVWVQNSVGNVWRNYIYLRGVRADNRDLKQQIEQMRIEQVRLSEDAAQARRLQALLNFKEQFIAKTVAAQVIGSSGSDVSRILYIDKGEDAGLRRDMAVMTADGIVGKVTLVYPSVSQVLLINDSTSGVGVLLEKTRLQGVLRGTANGEVVLERVMSDEQVPVGEAVLTSGGDQIFPKGLPVGTVAKVGNGKDLFLNIKVRPAANLSKLEEVLVLLEKQDRQATAEDTGRMRAVDILAARLPSVPEKPPDAKAGEGAASTAAGAGGSAAGNAKTPVGAATAQTQAKANVQPKTPMAKPDQPQSAQSESAQPRSLQPRPVQPRPVQPRPVQPGQDQVSGGEAPAAENGVGTNGAQPSPDSGIAKPDSTAPKNLKPATPSTPSQTNPQPSAGDDGSPHRKGELTR